MSFAGFVNLHTHTPRCGHASGGEREYAEKALANGMKAIGFSDHCPYVFPGGYYSRHRMRPAEAGDYVSTLLGLEREYKGRLDVRIGYEVEYYPAWFAQTHALLTSRRCDFLILGQHFLYNEYDKRVHCYRAETDPDVLNLYVDQTLAGMRTGVFTYLAHPDLMDLAGEDAASGKAYRAAYSRLIAGAIDMKMPLEINFHGIVDGRSYPSDRFFALAGEMGAEVCFGCDAHVPEEIVDSAALRRAEEMVERHSLRFVPFPSLRNPV